MNKKYLFVLCFSIILITLYYNRKIVQIKWTEIFKQDALFVNYNSNGKIDGEVKSYINGKIYATGNVINGVKQGWEIMYYENGKIKSRTFFVNGQPSGKGFLYNDNGKLLYSGGYMNGGRYGNWYNYYDNGHIKEYLLYDIYRILAFSIGYKNSGEMNLKDMQGLVVSPYIYSINSKTRSIVPLDRKTSPDMSFNDINDLYITVANAPGAKLTLNLKINSTSFTFKNIKSSTLKIPNAFLGKGIYNILIDSHFYNANGQHINGMNINYLIKKT